MTMTSEVSPPLEIEPAEIDLVYSAACRQVRDAHLAEDVTQAVFLLLGRKWHLVPRGGTRAGWLIKTTCFVSKTAIRQAMRRRRHEQKAAEMAPTRQSAAQEADWTSIAGQLDDALAALGRTDRSAVVLRYLQDKPLKEVAAALGVSESGAGKRVTRALKKLRTELAARGVTASTAGLSAMLPLHAVQPAPPELAMAVRGGHASPAGIALSHVRLGMLAVGKAVAAGGTVLALTVGVVWMGTILYRATPPAPIAMPTPAAAHSLRLTIIDPDTKAPLPGVDVTVRVDYMPQRYVTDAQGVCVVEWPTRTPGDILIRTHQAGRVPMRLWWMNFASALHGGLPSTYTLSMEAATTIGGAVVDEAGKPVAGATVTVSSPYSGLGQDVPLQDLDKYPVTTDAQGRWTFDAFPVKANERASIRVSHEGLSGSEISLSDPAKGLDGTLQIVLKKKEEPSPLAVHVIDPSGKSIAGARIVVGDNGDPNFTKGKTDGNGLFHFVPKPGTREVILTAIVPGFAPTIRNIGPPVPSVELKMAPGRVIRGKVLRADGSPFAGVQVKADFYQRDPSVENPYYLSTQTLPYEARTDVKGAFTYSTAPTTGTITMSASVPGFMSGFLTFEDNNEASITLYPVLKVHGTVTDARTGKKIDKFRMTQGMERQTRTLEQGEAMTGQRIFWEDSYPGSRVLSDGWYEATCDNVASGYALRVEAAGYAAQVCPTIRPGPSDVTVDFKLEPAKNVTGVVRQADGSAVEGADVVLIADSVEGSAYVEGGRLKAIYGGFSRAKTAKDGRYEFPPPFGAYHVMAIHSTFGYANVDGETLAKNGGEIQLGAWGTVQGVVKVGKHIPLSGVSVAITFRLPPGSSMRGVLFEAVEDVDADGRFTVEHMPPMAGTVWAIERGPAHGEGMTKGSSVYRPIGLAHGAPFKMKAGKTIHVEIDARGRPVIGRIAIPAELRNAIDWKQSGGSLHVDLPDPPSPKPWKTMSDKEKQAWAVPWMKSPEGKAWIEANQSSSPMNFQAHLKPDGTFRMEDVPAGNYKLILTVFTSKDIREQNRRPVAGVVQMQFKVPLIPGGESDEPLDLGTLPMRKLPPQ